MTSKRDRWAQYAAAAMANPDPNRSPIGVFANAGLDAEEQLFGPFPAEPVQRPQPVTLECALSGAAPSGTWVRGQEAATDFCFTGKIVGFRDGAYVVLDDKRERLMEPCDVSGVVSHDPDVRAAERDAELLEDDVRTLEERTAQLKLERDEARARAAELDAALAAVANEGERQLAELRAQLAGSVPVAELRAMVAEWEHDVETNSVHLVDACREIHSCAKHVRVLITAAEQRAAAQTGEG